AARAVAGQRRSRGGGGLRPAGARPGDGGAGVRGRGGAPADERLPGVLGAAGDPHGAGGSLPAAGPRTAPLGSAPPIVVRSPIVQRRTTSSASCAVIPLIHARPRVPSS